jgi:hypothetical protein
VVQGGGLYKVATIGVCPGFGLITSIIPVVALGLQTCVVLMTGSGKQQAGLALKLLRILNKLGFPVLMVIGKGPKCSKQAFSPSKLAESKFPTGKTLHKSSVSLKAIWYWILAPGGKTTELSAIVV